MKYFGEDDYVANECDVAYNATQMALQWDALATSDTRVMLAAQNEISKKPFGTTWINYTRCHDDIGLGYDDEMIASAGFNPFEHRKFIKDFYSGMHQYSYSSGALFSVNPKTNDARISGTLASLCGLEKAINLNSKTHIQAAINRIVLMQATTLFYGGIPMLFYGDEVGYMNDYSYLNDKSKSYDNRWMHRPLIDWDLKNNNCNTTNSIEQKIFSATQKLIHLRKQYIEFSDTKNLQWLSAQNIHIAGYIRHSAEKSIYCFFNFSSRVTYLTWYAFKEQTNAFTSITNLINNVKQTIGTDDEYLVFQPYEFMILEAK
jgi:amylosucrase